MSIKSTRERIAFFALGVVVTLGIQIVSVVAIGLIAGDSFTLGSPSSLPSEKGQLSRNATTAQPQQPEPGSLKADLQAIEEEVEELLNLNEPEPQAQFRTHGGVL